MVDLQDQLTHTPAESGKRTHRRCVPPLLAKAIYTDEIANNGVRQKELDIDVDRKWEDAWSTFKSR